MKIDKRNPWHWLCLVALGGYALLAWVLRPLLYRRRQRPIVILYGHKLAGNLLALYRYWRMHAQQEYNFVFLTMDVRYARELLADGVPVQLAIAPGATALLIHAAAVISDHGLHSMSFLPGRCSLKFFDVWHGFGYKGHDPRDFKVLRRYDEVWVSSPKQRGFYLDQFHFNPTVVKATGYARRDRLVTRQESVDALKAQFDFADPDLGKVILYAPTWQQDDARRSMFPFGVDEDEFLGDLSRLAVANHATIVIRAHLNTAIAPHAFPRVAWRPLDRYPDTEGLLLVSDVLLCDWSSIAIDWLVLDRPTVFLDVPVPFARGHTLGARHRYGEIVASSEAMCRMVATYLRDSHAYWDMHGQYAASIKAEVLGDLLDGRAAERCVARLTSHLRPAQRGAGVQES